MNNLEMTTAKAGDTCRIQLVGEATIYDAAELKERLVVELDRSLQLDLDLAQVHEIDTAGLQVLLLLQRECEQHSKTLHLVQPSQAVQNLISLFGLDNCFSMPQPELPKEEARP